MERDKRLLSLGITLAVSASAGLLCMWVQGGSIGEGLWPLDSSPPVAAFHILRGLLWLLSGVSAARVLRSAAPERHEALQIWAAQAAGMVLRDVFYYRFHAVPLVFFWLVFLMLLGLRICRDFALCSPGAGRLQIPCVLYLGLLLLLHLRVWLI